MNTGNVEQIAAFVSPDYAEVYNNVRYPMGLAGAKEHVTGVRKAYPDLLLTAVIPLDGGRSACGPDPEERTVTQ